MIFSRRSVLRAPLGLSIGIAIGSGTGISSGPAYDWTTDPLITSRVRADNPTTDLAPSPVLTLALQGGAIATGTDADGNTTLEITAATNHWLKATCASGAIGRGDTTVIFVAKAGTAPTNFMCWFCNASAGNSFLTYNTAANVQLTSSGVKNIACTPANRSAFAMYLQPFATQVSLNNGAYSAFTANGTGIGFLDTGYCIGSQNGANTANLSFSECIVIEGAPHTWSTQFRNGLAGYLNSRYPSLSLGSTLAQTASYNETTLHALFSAPFDFWIPAGQSNIGNNSTVATTLGGANTFELGNDNVIKAFAALYDDQTNQQDEVTFDSSAGKAGGPCGQFVHDYVAATGRPCVIVPCLIGGSGYLGDTLSVTTARWEPSYPRGNKKRNSPYGSMKARYDNMIALGGTYRGLLWYQGEASIANSSTWAASTKAVLDAWAAYTGVDRVILQQLQDYPQGAGVQAALQTAVTTLAVAGSRLVNLKTATGGFESDNIHNNNVKSNAVGAAWAALALAQTAGTGWF